MFWGISLENGKRYSQTVEQSFHISMAALNAKNSSKGAVTIMVEVEKACYPLCTLNMEKIPQQPLDYVFTEGEEVLFYTEGGDMEVHLTGYLIDDLNPVEYSTDDESASNASSSEEEHEQNNSNEEESSEDDNLQTLISELDGLNEDNNEDAVDMWLPRSARKKQKKNDETKQPQISLTEKLLDDASDESEDDDWQPGRKRKVAKKKNCGEAEGEEILSNSPNEKHPWESSDNLNKDGVSLKSKKKVPKDKSQSSLNGLHDSAQDINDTKNSQDEKSPAEDSKSKLDTATSEGQHERKHLSGGTVIEDIVKGTGKKAKKGRKVSLYYKGSLKKSKKVFDECLSGEPFTLRLGSGEVIKGWDIGIEGMHVGGKRRLVIPPSQAYGSKPMGASIPPNSTLVFIVELMKVN